MKRAVVILAGIVALAALATGILRLTASHAAGLPAVGQVISAAQRPRAPGLSGSTLTGGHLNTASLRGHVVVLNFWGAWCAPCRAEAPTLNRVAGDTSFLGVRFVGIDIREDPAAGLVFERSFHITYPSISDPDNLLAVRFGSHAPLATPTTYIVDPDGRIAWAWFGRTSYEQLELAVVTVARP
jgi:thiol-disulfide isomerase/thioredoxin